MFICADHGNAEQLIDYETGEPLTGSYNKPGSVYPRKCRSEIYLKRERMPCRHHSYTDPAYGNGTAGRHDRKKPSDRKIKIETNLNIGK